VKVERVVVAFVVLVMRATSSALRAVVLGPGVTRHRVGLPRRARQVRTSAPAGSLRSPRAPGGRLLHRTRRHRATAGRWLWQGASFGARGSLGIEAYVTDPVAEALNL
jgi:hypothetical protein